MTLLQLSELYTGTELDQRLDDLASILGAIEGRVGLAWTVNGEAVDPETVHDAGMRLLSIAERARDHNRPV